MATKHAVRIAWMGLAIAGLPGIVHGQPPRPDTARIEELTGLKGTYNEKEGVFKVSMPRTDLEVSANGVRLTPPMGLTCWASFQGSGSRALVMGDMVMTEEQIDPVMSTALENDLEVTALHNHFLYESPRIMFMHVGGQGDEAKLAAAVGKVFTKIKQTSTGKVPPPHTDIDPAKTSLDPAKIEAVLGRKGELASGVYKITIGRSTSMMGQTVGNTMGVNTWAAFAGSDERAIVDGDFVMTESELRPVLVALRGANISIVAIHNHMVMEQPRMMFLHFWGVGPTIRLAQGIEAALEKQAK